jgi:dipeptidyl aminopeptidase/acylaminoacyl peptidase
MNHCPGGILTMNRRACLAALAGLALAACAAAAPAAPTRNHDLTPEDTFSLTILENLAVSPDGTQAAYTENRWGDDDKGRTSDLWVVATAGGPARRLTFDGFGGGSVTWSPDGRWLYFMGRDRAGREAPPRDGSTQVWRLAPDGGTPVPVTRAKKGVDAFELSPDGRTLWYLVGRERTDDDWGELLGRYDDLHYGHGVTTLSELRRLDLETWRDDVAAPATRVVSEMALSPDGTRLAMITAPDNELIFKEGWSRVDVLDLASGAVTELTGQAWRDAHKSPYGWIDDLAWSADGRALAFAIAYDGYATDIWVAEERDGSWPLQRISRPDPWHYDGGLAWRGGGRTLCWRGEALARVQVLATEGVTGGAQGRTVELTTGDLVVTAFAFDRKGASLVAAWETPLDANDLYAVAGPAKHRRLTRVNPQVDTWKLPQISHVSWTGADGKTCWGILELPPDWKPGDGPLPAIVEIHGGPTSSTRIGLRHWMYGRGLMPARGYALLSPNYRGSTGYGDTFLEELIGRENDIEVRDITAGVRWLVDQGYADPKRLGVMGWSNGGYLTNCLIAAEPAMFAAASSGAGVLDMVIQWGTEDTPGHVINFVRGLPWQQPEEYRKASPLYALDRVRTPTIIHVGGSDPRVPAAHSRALYRALRHYLDVPVQLVEYPGEPHGLTTRRNRMAKMEWDLAWFDRYLLGKTAQEGSPAGD